MQLKFHQRLLNFLGAYDYDLDHCNRNTFDFRSRCFGFECGSGGVALAIALKTKDTNKKALASSAGITAICGITEPALYGVTLQNKAALIGSIVAGGVGGFFLGILGARNFAGGSPGLLTIAAYIGEDTLKYFYTAIAGLVISVVVSFIVTFVLYKED
ncbi:MAG: hypothetical protein ACLR3O_03740 [Streptococcus sp.]